MAASLRDSFCLTLSDPSQVGEARRAGVGLADRLGFAPTRRAELAIVLTEAATNVLKHGGGGELVLRPLDRDGTAGVEVLAIDRGRGIRHVGQAMADGFSTGGTAGTGLGAIRRLASEFDVFSAAATTLPPPAAPAGGAPAAKPVCCGTVLMARLWDAAAVPPPPGGVEVGVVCLPKAGEPACGDAWAVSADARDGRWVAMVADGLGHGLHAAEASRQADRLFRQHVGGPGGSTDSPGSAGLAPVLQAMHAGLRGTRGAAVSMVELSPDRRQVRFCGVGNVAGVVVGSDGATRNMVPHNGTVGAELRRVQEFSYPVPPAGGLLVLHTDGVGSHWSLAAYPGLRNRHPAVIAGVLYRDHRRVRDDATAFVAGVPAGRAGGGGGPAEGGHQPGVHDR